MVIPIKTFTFLEGLEGGLVRFDRGTGSFYDGSVVGKVTTHEMQTPKIIDIDRIPSNIDWTKIYGNMLKRTYEEDIKFLENADVNDKEAQKRAKKHIHFLFVHEKDGIFYSTITGAEEYYLNKDARLAAIYRKFLDYVQYP